MGVVEVATLVLVSLNVCVLVAVVALIGYYYPALVAFVENQDYVMCCVKNLCEMIPDKSSPCKKPREEKVT
jgi:hypothetical protein